MPEVAHNDVQSSRPFLKDGPLGSNVTNMVDMTMRMIHQVELIHLEGSPVSLRLLQPDSPLDANGFAQLETERVGKGIENIDAKNPDPYSELKRLSKGMRMDVPNIDIEDPMKSFPKEQVSLNDSMRYTVVDASGKPVYPTEGYEKRLHMIDEQGNPIDIAIGPETPKPSEGIPLGNVVFFREDPSRLDQLGIEHSELRDPTRSSAPDNPPKKLFLEISYYRLDDLKEQFPHLKPIVDADGNTVLTPFQCGIYTAIVDVLGKAKAMGFEPNDVTIMGYTNADNEQSIHVLKRFGFKQLADVPVYAEDYQHPRTSFLLGEEQWDGFKKLYTDSIAPNAKHIDFPKTLIETKTVDSPLGIPVEIMKPGIGPVDFGIDIEAPSTFQSRPFEETLQLKEWNERRISKAKKDLEKYFPSAEPKIKAIFTNIFKVNQGEKGAVILDSATDLSAAAGMMKAAESLGLKLDVIVLRDKAEENLTMTSDFLRQFESDSIKVRSYDMMNTKEEYLKALDEYWSGFYDYNVCMTNHSYDIRIKRLAEMAYRQGPMIMMPGITIEGLTSPVFEADREKMNVLGNQFRFLMKDADHVRILCPEDGTDFTYYLEPTRDWFIESELDFSKRRDPDISKLGQGERMPVDNWGGEVYTINTLNEQGERMAHGIWNIYWPDADPYFEAFNRGELTHEEFQKLVTDRTDQIKVTLEKGKMINIEGERKAEILRHYLEEKSANDKWHDANLYVVEFGAGLNYQARSPEQHGDEIVMTIEAEKKAYLPPGQENPTGGMIHFGVGESYLEPRFTSNTHLDHVVAVPEGATLFMVIEKKDGSALLLRAPNGVFDYYQYRTIQQADVESVVEDLKNKQ